ncbi:MAG: hypothetical protein Q8Q31_05880 [Nanoarchaeota archaeon]|nr:hypothetical protein [Nanoarchaeota archaeon]
MEFYKYAVAYIVRNPEKKLLLVNSQDHEEGFLDGWGLPVEYVGDDETEHQAIARSGKQRLGVELKVANFIGRDRMKKEDCTLELGVFEVKILAGGKPTILESGAGSFQYLECRWGTTEDFKESARNGDLASKLYLQSLWRDWEI